MNTKKLLLKFQVLSFFLDAILGVFLHFTYEISNNNPIVGIFSAINESTWEHLKLIFFPMLFSTFIRLLLFLEKKSEVFMFKNNFYFNFNDFYNGIFLYIYWHIR